MKVTYRDQVYDLDTVHISFRHALEIQRQTEMSVGEWQALLFWSRDEHDGQRPPREYLIAWAALYWLMLAQSGEDTDPDEIDFDTGDFMDAYLKALSAEVERAKAAAPEPEPDPTPPRAAARGQASSARGTRTGTTRKPRAREGGRSTGSG